MLIAPEKSKTEKRDNRLNDAVVGTAPGDGTQEPQTLRSFVEEAMRNYFSILDGQKVTDVYQMVLTEIEPPLLEAVMEYVNGNQTKASELLGMNRGTFRKKLKRYGITNESRIIRDPKYTFKVAPPQVWPGKTSI